MKTKTGRESKRQGGAPIGDLAAAMGLKHEAGTDRAPSRIAQSLDKLSGRLQQAARKRR
jgi:hypothetical protein